MSESEPTKISATRDSDFEVQLESSPTSGALWHFLPAGEGPELITQTTIPNTQSIGGTARQVFTFRAGAPGNHKLVFELRRAWESSASERQEILVDVK